MRRYLIVEGRPTWAHGELERPELTLVVDHARNVAEANVIETVQELRNLFQGCIGELRFPDIHRRRSHFACVGAEIVVHQLLVLEILVPPFAPSPGPEPSSDCHFGAAD